jgi:60 kDa SS-A/Ro ribonucleoprotein
MSDAQFTARVNELIDAGRLPYETVTGIVKPTTEIWEHLMQQMPIFALVRHLNTLEGAGVFSKKANVDWVCGQLKNPDIIQKSRMLPFRFSTAHKAFNGNLQVKNALATALDLSLANASVLPGKNAIYLDVSGSMSAEYLEIGSLLGLAAVKKSQDSSFLFFDDNLGRPAINPDDTVMTNMRACQNAFTHGCTETDLCIKHLLGTAGIRGYNSRFPASEKNNAPVKVDNILIFTDEQQNSGTPVVNRFKEYRQKVNKNAKLFIVDIAPYNHRMANQDEPGVTFIYGWSETVLDVIRYSMEGSGSHVDQIKLMK